MTTDGGQAEDYAALWAQRNDFWKRLVLAQAEVERLRWMLDTEILREWDERHPDPHEAAHHASFAVFKRTHMADLARRYEEEKH